MKRSTRTLVELRRICQLIDESPPGRAPNMTSIYAKVEAERRAGLLRAA
jgi:hypothetical protein